MVRKRENAGERLGLAGPRTCEDRIAQADAMLFHVVEEPAGPDKFRRQQTQSESDSQPARAGSDDHDDAQSEQREANKNLQEALGLLNRLEKHPFNPIQAANAPLVRLNH